MTRVVIRFAITVLLVNGFACSPAARRAAPGGSLTSGNHTVALRHGGRLRSDIVHVPPGALAGPQSTLIRAADEVWAFVSRFRLP